MFSNIRNICNKACDYVKSVVSTVLDSAKRAVQRTLSDVYRLLTGKWDNELLSTPTFHVATLLYTASVYYIAGVCATVWIAILFNSALALLNIALWLMIVFWVLSFVAVVRNADVLAQGN